MFFLISGVIEVLNPQIETDLGELTGLDKLVSRPKPQIVKNSLKSKNASLPKNDYSTQEAKPKTNSNSMTNRLSINSKRILGSRRNSARNIRASFSQTRKAFCIKDDPKIKEPKNWMNSNQETRKKVSDIINSQPQKQFLNRYFLRNSCHVTTEPKIDFDQIRKICTLTKNRNRLSVFDKMLILKTQSNTGSIKPHESLSRSKEVFESKNIAKLDLLNKNKLYLSKNQKRSIFNIHKSRMKKSISSQISLNKVSTIISKPRMNSLNSTKNSKKSQKNFNTRKTDFSQQRSSFTDHGKLYFFNSINKSPNIMENYDPNILDEKPYLLSVQEKQIASPNESNNKVSKINIPLPSRMNFLKHKKQLETVNIDVIMKIYDSQKLEIDKLEIIKDIEKRRQTRRTKVYGIDSQESVIEDANIVVYNKKKYFKIVELSGKRMIGETGVIFNQRRNSSIGCKTICQFAIIEATWIAEIISIILNSL